jgi:hypothetical protein
LFDGLSIVVLFFFLILHLALGLDDTRVKVLAHVQAESKGSKLPDGQKEVASCLYSINVFFLADELDNDAPEAESHSLHLVEHPVQRWYVHGFQPLDPKLCLLRDFVDAHKELCSSGNYMDALCTDQAGRLSSEKDIALVAAIALYRYVVYQDEVFLIDGCRKQRCSKIREQALQRLLAC